MRIPMFACGKKKVLDSNFDSGSSSAITFEDINTVRIAPIKHWNNQWAWIAVRTNRFAGKIPHFLIAKSNHYNIAAGEWLVCWSNALDTDTWHAFDHVDVGASDIEFYNDTQFPSGMIFICSLPAYPFGRVQRRVSELSLSGYASDTISSSAYVLGYSTSRDANDGTGKLSPVLPFLAMKISNPVANTKNNIVLVSGNHPSETSGRYALIDGAISWIVGSTPQAKFFRDWCSVFLYPCVNPQGVYSGYFRSCPETPTSDNNRLWDDTGVNEAIDLFKTAIAADTEGNVEVVLDFHSWMEAWECRGYTNDPSDALHALFASKLSVLEPAYQLVEMTSAETAANVLRVAYSPQLAITQECGGITSRQVPEWKSYGQYTMQVLAEMLAEGRFNHGPGVGSRSFNGTTDRIDWNSILNPAGQAFTFAANVYLASNPVNGYFLCVHDAGNTAPGLVINDVSTGILDFLRKGAGGNYLWFHNVNALTVEGWHHVIVTSDGGLLSGSVTMRIDGASVAVTFTNGSGAETAHTGKWSVGGRIYDNTRNLPGRVAQVRWFDRVLTESEQLLEASGVLSTTIGLRFWHKANTSGLHDEVTDTEGTASGTTQLTGIGNGPSVYYP